MSNAAKTIVPENLQNVEISGYSIWDYPDFTDAYVEYAEYENGTPLSDAELETLNYTCKTWILESATENLA